MAEPPVKKPQAPFLDSSDSAKRTRWILRVVSVVFAVVLWIFVTWDGNTSGTRELRVLLKYEGLPDGYSVSSTTRDIKVVVEGRLESLPLFSGNMVTALVGMQDLRPGKYRRVPVQITLPESMRLVSYSPQVVDFELFRIIERMLRPRLAIKGELPRGYSLNDFQTTPQEITVRGREEVVLSVRRAEVQGTFAELRGGLAKELPIALMGERDEVKGLVVEPSSVQVSAKFSESFEDKTVPVKATTKGSPIATLAVSSVIVSPDVVTLRGPRSELQNISEIRLDAIDVEGAEEDINMELPLSLPGSEITVVGQTTAHVRIQFQSAVERNTFLDVPIEVRGRGVYQDWNVTPSRASVTIEWPVTAGMTIDQLKPPFAIYVDVTNVVSQQLSLPLLVKDLPLGIHIIRLEPERVTVKAVIP